MGVFEAVLMILSGAFSTKLLDVIVNGWKQRARAKGRRESLVDVLHRSRLIWREATYHARGIAIKHHGEPDLKPTPDDPYDAYASGKDHE